MNINMKVYGLLGKFNYEVEINESEGIIIIGENGKGKTSLLTVIYGILNNVSSLLYRTDFSKITICLNEEEHVISRDIFNEYYRNIENKKSLLRRFIIEEVQSNEELRILHQEKVDSMSISDRRARGRYETAILNDKVLMEEYISFVSSIANDEDIDIDTSFILILQKIKKFIDNSNLRILFLPVSRVVESKNISNKSNLNSLESIEEVIQDNLSKYMRAQYDMNTAINTNLFQFLLNQESFSNDKKIESYSIEKLEQIIDELSELESINENQEKLKAIINMDKKSPNKEVIIDFLFNMDREFNSQLEYKVIGDKFINLAKEANKFLRNSDKKFEFNKREVTFILKDSTNNEISLNDLSSGESHLIKILCELYLLPDDKNILVIIDEPELSLSIEWQEMLMNSIISSPHYYSMVAATHSPFILGDNQEYINMLKPIHSLVIKND